MVGTEPTSLAGVPLLTGGVPFAGLQTIQAFANALDQRRFHEAFAMQSSGMSEAGFVKQFADFKSIQTEIGQPTPAEGAPSSPTLSSPSIPPRKRQSAHRRRP